MKQTRVITGQDAQHINPKQLLATDEPVILRGAIRHWPLVQQGVASHRDAMTYLRTFDRGQPILVYSGAPEIEGRFFYNQDLTGLNFATDWLSLGDFLDRIDDHAGDRRPPSFYVGSLDADTFLPGLRADNPLGEDDGLFGEVQPWTSVWLGNRTTACAHFDMSNNIACCAVGRRRFTLFPPEQIHNLYPGPLEPTPGGQVVSMVDITNPDYEQHPRFGRALDAAQVADLEAGDLLFYPALWWHHVEALEAFNVLVNYWWNPSPEYTDTPMNTLLHGLLSLRDRPEPEKRAWKELFDYYVFGPAERPQSHLPEHARGELAPLDASMARRLRGRLIQRLNR